MNMTLPYTSRNLLMKCISISLAIHLGLVTFFYFHPFILQGPFNSLFGITVATPSLIDAEDEEAIAEENSRVLKEVFEQVVVLPPHLQQPYDLSELPKGMALAPSQETPVPFLAHDAALPEFAAGKRETAVARAPALPEFSDEPGSDFLPSFDITPPIASQLQIDAEPIVGTIQPQEAPVGPGMFEDLVAVSDFSLHASYETDYSLNLSPQLVSAHALKGGEELQLKTEIVPQAAQVTPRDLNMQTEKVRSTLFIPKTAQNLTEKREVEVASAAEQLENYEFPATAMAAEWNNQFDVDITFLPNPEGKGYIFSLAVQPNYDFSSHSLKQNLYFVIDRSNSAQKHRFGVFKRSVLKALGSMQQGDTFNILIVDKKITALSPQNLSVSIKNIQKAEEFLDSQEAGGMFASGEVYSSLDKVLARIPDNDEAHAAILLTDGKSSLSNERKQNIFKKWVEKNNGRLSLYAAAVGQHNDVLTLDMLCSISGGKLIYSDTHASLPRRLAKLVLDLKDPLVKDMMVTAQPHNPNSHIEFYPAGSHLPTLYSHSPYVLVGQIDDPCAFDLIIQGRHRDNWVAIRKNVSFIDGQKGTQALEMQWTAQRANVCYSKFLAEGKPAYLKDAREILKKSRQEIAFE